MYRTVHIHVTKEQLELLSQLNSRDPIYIDGLLSEVLAQTSFGTMQLVKEYSVDLAAELWKNIPNVPEIDFRSRSIYVNVLLLVFMYFVCRRFNISYMVALAFSGVYCLYEYLDYECHKVNINHCFINLCSYGSLHNFTQKKLTFVPNSESNWIGPLIIFMAKKRILVQHIQRTIGLRG